MRTYTELIQTHMEYEQRSSVMRYKAEPLSLDIINECLKGLEQFIHFEMKVKQYDHEEHWSQPTWIEVAGINYGWLWSYYDSKNWEYLPQRMMDIEKLMLKHKIRRFLLDKKRLLELLHEEVFVVHEADKILFHFVERENKKQDTIFTFSHSPLIFNREEEVIKNNAFLNPSQSEK